MITLDLPKDIERRLLVLSMHTGRTIQFCAREAILDYIDEIEERYLAIDRLRENSIAEEFDLLITRLACYFYKRLLCFNPPSRCPVGAIVSLTKIAAEALFMINNQLDFLLWPRLSFYSFCFCVSFVVKYQPHIENRESGMKDRN
jgi:RHH-type transcriptional regulator, rel operon repressor / antitoxin RelB